METNSFWGGNSDLGQRKCLLLFVERCSSYKKERNNVSSSTCFCKRKKTGLTFVCFLLTCMFP